MQAKTSWIPRKQDKRSRKRLKAPRSVGGLVCRSSGQEEEKEESGGVESGVKAARDAPLPLTGRDDEFATEEGNEMRVGACDTPGSDGNKTPGSELASVESGITARVLLAISQWF
ncbi:hypothetical protein GN958_ATG07594 [Phytophthora infestans]|uniref:Uncharacterized protein n=1 Tax=Phytophthora infestans TaxID=4787 RepID=A0A8S9US04_PHYIN|nr:hypothetical protein GN958_ATG07594 [Phytophthora infestans]